MERYEMFVYQEEKKAFTLIELLVVIAIIALLVSILLPSLNKAKQLARNVICKTNLRSLGTATYIYASDYEGWLPYQLNNSVSYFWVDCEIVYPWAGPGPQGLAGLFYGEYFTEVNLLFCPDEQDPVVIENANSGWDGKSVIRGLGYDYRQTARVEFAPTKIDQGPQPAKDYYWLRDTAPGLWMEGGWSLISDRWSMDNRINPSTGSFDNMHHGGLNNVWYMDGRVELCPVVFYAPYSSNSWPTGFEIFDGGTTPPQNGTIVVD